MFTQEQGNIVAMHAMGSNQCLHAFAHGYIRAGEDIDPPVSESAAPMEVRAEEGVENTGSDDNTDDEISNGTLNPERDLESRAGEVTAD